jgi:hypothetical protein
MPFCGPAQYLVQAFSVSIKSDKKWRAVVEKYQKTAIFY